MGYCDTYYACDYDTQGSTTSYVFNLGFGVIVWHGKRQAPMSFLIEAEYHEAKMASQESTWLVKLMKSLHQPIN